MVYSAGDIEMSIVNSKRFSSYCLIKQVILQSQELMFWYQCVLGKKKMKITFWFEKEGRFVNLGKQQCKLAHYHQGNRW
jgi:hypothetical protein